MSDQSPQQPSPHERSQVVVWEEKLTFQQRALEEMNQVVLGQQAELDRLQRELAVLRSTVERLMEQGLGENLPHEKPPHY